MSKIKAIKLGDTKYDIAVASENISGVVGLTKGGTGAESAAGARSNLGLGSAATRTATDTMTDDSKLPSASAVKLYVSSQLTSVLTYKGTIGATGATISTLPATHKVGDVYVVATAGTYAGKALEVGDYIICNTSGTTSNDSHWDAVNGENQIENKAASLAAPGSTATIATIDGTNITVTTPSNFATIVSGKLTLYNSALGQLAYILSDGDGILIHSPNGRVYIDNTIELDESGDCSIYISNNDDLHLNSSGKVILDADAVIVNNTPAHGGVFKWGNDTVATQTWVTAQGYAVGSNYLPLTGGTLTGPLVLSSTQGTFTISADYDDVDGFTVLNIQGSNNASIADEIQVHNDVSLLRLLTVSRDLYMMGGDIYFAGSRGYYTFGTAAWKDYTTSVTSGSTDLITSGGVYTALSNYVTSTGTAAKATQLANARTIGLSEGVLGTATSFNGTSNILIPVTSVKESYLTWGGKAITGDISPIDAACIDEFGHNKLAFLPADCIIVEYSTDGGSTWLDYGLTDEQKTKLVTENAAGSPIVVFAGQNIVAVTSTTPSNNRARIRIASHYNNTANTSILYTKLKKILINFGTGGTAGNHCVIRYRTIANWASGTETWVTVHDTGFNGNSGWNSYPWANTAPIDAFGAYNQSQSNQIGEIEIEFWSDSVGSSTGGNCLLLDIRFIGTTIWATPSTMARTGHLYEFDWLKNATFPSSVGITGDLKHGNYSYTLPNKNGTVALTSDIPSNSTSVLTVTANSFFTLDTMVSFMAEGENHTEIIRNTGSSKIKVTIYASSTVITPTGSDISFDIPAGGYGEYNYVKVGNVIYVRGV